MSNQQIPQDIKRPWLNVIRRLQSVARQARFEGHAILKLSVLVDSDGNPKLFGTPTIHTFEPKRSCDIESLQCLTGKDDEVVDLLSELVQ